MSTEKKLRSTLDELAHAVGWELLNSLTSKEIKDSYSGIAKAYNKAMRLLAARSANKGKE